MLCLPVLLDGYGSRKVTAGADVYGPGFSNLSVELGLMRPFPVYSIYMKIERYGKVCIVQNIGHFINHYVDTILLS